MTGRAALNREFVLSVKFSMTATRQVLGHQDKRDEPLPDASHPRRSFDRLEGLEQGGKIVEGEHRGGVGEGVGWVGVNFEEEGIDADRDGGARQVRHELALPAARRSLPAGLLNRMRAVEDDRDARTSAPSAAGYGNPRRACCSRTRRRAPSPGRACCPLLSTLATAFAISHGARN